MWLVRLSTVAVLMTISLVCPAQTLGIPNYVWRSKAEAITGQKFGRLYEQNGRWRSSSRLGNTNVYPYRSSFPVKPVADLQHPLLTYSSQQRRSSQGKTSQLVDEGPTAAAKRVPEETTFSVEKEKGVPLLTSNKELPTGKVTISRADHVDNGIGTKRGFIHMIHFTEQQLQSMKTEHTRVKTELRREKQAKESLGTENERLMTELRREKQAKQCSFDLCRKLEEDLKNQAEADKREIARLREQIISSTGCYYTMAHVPRGVAIIINNIHFQDMAKRVGAEADTDRLREAFESLGFTVLTFCDLDHAKMVTVMMEQGKADHFNYDCFVCCVMSHGTMGKVFSSNDVGIDIYDLMKLFNAKRCPSLKGKPKLFFVQACQGEKCQGRETFDHGVHDAKPVPFICHEADFFLGLSTVPGYVARRDHDGAPYVHHLAKMLTEFGQTHDLSTIMAKVCDKMNEINDDKFGWISSNHSTLRKKVVFNTQ